MKNLDAAIEKLKTKLRKSRFGRDPQEHLDEEREAEIEKEIEGLERCQCSEEDRRSDGEI